MDDTDGEVISDELEPYFLLSDTVVHVALLGAPVTVGDLLSGVGLCGNDTTGVTSGEATEVLRPDEFTVGGID